MKLTTKEIKEEQRKAGLEQKEIGKNFKIGDTILYEGKEVKIKYTDGYLVYFRFKGDDIGISTTLVEKII
jgi:hypothetical protein